MMNLKLSSSLAAAASLALIVACGTGTDASSRVAAPSGANYVLTTASVGDAGNGVVNQGEVEVCKEGTDATFNVGPTGGASAVVAVANHTCKVVVVDLTTNGTANSYTISEVASPSYTLQSIMRETIQFVAGTDTDAPVVGPASTTDPVVALVNRFHGVRLVYTNTPVEQHGCTYTKGWSRNNGSNTIIAVDGRTVGQEQQIFAATPGKPGSVTWGDDNNNLNLYQQLLAALNNLGGDATAGPPAVDAAISAALAATSGTGTAIIVAPVTDVSGLISVLSSFNEGELTGWPHCN